MKPYRFRCRGMVVAALLLVVAGVAVTALVLDRVTLHHTRAVAGDAAVLREARLALLGYTAAYPDRVNAAFGPGYLPCPARDARGIAASACSAASGSTRGRLPWHTLRTNDLRDSAGESLWYALAPELRYNPKQVPLTSELVPSLTIDGEPVAAVIVAPGPPAPGQGRRHDRADEVCQFLEGVNCNGDVLRFTRGERSDRLVVISSAAWRRAIESRALGALGDGLNDWAGRYGGRYPWLVSEAARLAVVTPAAPVTNAGVLPYHASAALAPHTPSAYYQTRMSLSAELFGAAIRDDDPHGLIPPACRHRVPCDNGVAGGLAGTAQCEWRRLRDAVPPARTVACTFSGAFTYAGRRIVAEVRLRLLAPPGGVQVSPPTADRPRRRSVMMALPVVGTRPFHMTLTVDAAAGVSATVRVSARAGTSGFVHAADLHYAIDVDGGELPVWLADAGWLRLLHVAWRDAGCGAANTCLRLLRERLRGVTTGLDDIRALLVSPGPPLPQAPARLPGALPGAWFERDNAEIATRVYRDGAAARGFNDRVQVVARLP